MGKKETPAMPKLWISEDSIIEEVVANIICNHYPKLVGIGDLDVHLVLIL